MDELPRISPLRMALFAAYARRYVRRHFHRLLLARAPGARLPESGPLVVYLNHPSWWDPLVCLLLARALLPGRRSFAPIEAGALARYPLLAHLGFFGVAAGSTRGAAAFLRAGARVLAARDAVLWVTPHGEFVDPRARPVRLRPGLGHLLARSAGATVVPLALEYVFFTERLPEVLVRLGRPLEVSAAPEGAGAWTERLAQRLQRTQDELAALALRRDPGAFEELLRGHGGIGLVYDGWRALCALARGERFARAHGREAEAR